MPFFNHRAAVDRVLQDNRAPRVITLSCCDDIPAMRLFGDDVIQPEPKWIVVSKATVPDTATKAKLSANCTKTAGIRLTVSGTRLSNTSGSVGIKHIIINAPNPAALWTPTLTLLEELQSWLARVRACCSPVAVAAVPDVPATFCARRLVAAVKSWLMTRWLPRCASHSRLDPCTPC